MPFTPYHFGPSGLIGYVFRKWIDFPVFVLANVIVDFEVLIVNFLRLGWPYHRYAHTFLFGALLGLAWGAVAYFIQPLLKFGMNIIRINYTPSFKKMLYSGVLGVWLHVLIDSIYHYDPKPFWPIMKNYLWRIILQNQVKLVCLICLGVFLILYLLPTFKQFLKKR
jgi:membrane-bound metal-dependent hydrolase YbcI (DUF457 family)